MLVSIQGIAIFQGRTSQRECFPGNLIEDIAVYLEEILYLENRLPANMLVGQNQVRHLARALLTIVKRREALAEQPVVP